jgi:hypothetical protein
LFQTIAFSNHPALGFKSGFFIFPKQTAFVGAIVPSSPMQWRLTSVNSGIFSPLLERFPKFCSRCRRRIATEARVSVLDCASLIWQ